MWIHEFDKRATTDFIQFFKNTFFVLFYYIPPPPYTTITGKVEFLEISFWERPVQTLPTPWVGKIKKKMASGSGFFYSFFFIKIGTKKKQNPSNILWRHSTCLLPPSNENALKCLFFSNFDQ
jgi:hypothetical protein